MKRMASASLSAAMMMTAAAPVVTSLPVMAASSANTNNNTADTKDLAHADVIDMSKTGSITVHKYDITSAEAAGAYTMGQYKATGQTDMRVENALSKYAIQGVQFTYLRLGNVEQYSNTTADGSQLKVVYEIPTALADILKLSEADATVMTGDGISTPCTNTGVLHYTSTQINDALDAILKADDVAAKNALESYLLDYATQSTDGDDKQAADTGVLETDANGIASKDKLALGLYLMVETKVPEQVTSTVNPFFVSLPFTNTTADDNAETDHAADGVTDKIGGEKWVYDYVAYPKNQTGNPTIDKAVRNAYSSDSAHKNDKVTTTEGTNYSGTNDSTSLIVYNKDTASDNKADTSDTAYVANRGGYTGEGNNVAGKDGKGYSNDYKYDDTTTASEGDLLDYRIVSKLPHITSKATYLSQYTFTDALSTGITYNQESFKIAFYDNKADAEANNTNAAKEIWDLKDNKHQAAFATVSVDDGDGSEKVTANKATVKLTEKGLNQINGVNIKGAGNPYEAGDAKAGYSDYYMVLYYTATVNSDATVTLGDKGNVNDVSLVWSRTNNKYSNSLQDRNYVYSYGIDLTKTFSDNKGDATKVQFKLYNKTDAYYVIAKKGEDGLYYVTGKTTDKAQGTTFTPAATGRLYIKGLEGDKYQLTEVATDDGYSLLKDQGIIDVHETKRDLKASVAGTTGLEPAVADAIIKNYGTGIKNEDGQLVNAASTDIGGKAVAGPANETANGRTIGKTDMYEGDIQAATATMDGKPCTMLTSSTGDTSSPNAEIKMAIQNDKSPRIPLTGGQGMVVMLVAGVGLVVGGTYIAKKKKEDSVAC